MNEAAVIICMQCSADLSAASNMALILLNLTPNPLRSATTGSRGPHTADIQLSDVELYPQIQGSALLFFLVEFRKKRKSLRVLLLQKTDNIITYMYLLFFFKFLLFIHI